MDPEVCGKLFEVTRVKSMMLNGALVVFKTQSYHAMMKASKQQKTGELPKLSNIPCRNRADDETARSCFEGKFQVETASRVYETVLNIKLFGTSITCTMKRKNSFIRIWSSLIKIFCQETVTREPAQCSRKINGHWQLIGGQSYASFISKFK